MAGDSRDGDLQYAQPPASVYRLCQLCAEVRGTGQKNYIHIHMLEEVQKSEGLLIQCRCSEISLVVFVQSCLLMLDISEKCGMPVPIHADEIHRSRFLPQSGCSAATTEYKACTEDCIM